MHFQKFWDSCAQNKTSEISKMHCHVIVGLRLATQSVGNLKKNVNFVLVLNKVHVLALHTEHVLRLNKAAVLALNKAQVLRRSTKIAMIAQCAQPTQRKSQRSDR